MPTRYEYDLDRNGDWRWIAVAETGATSAISPVGYASLQDCMHAVGLMRAPGDLAVLPGIDGLPQVAKPPDSPRESLSRLHRRTPAA